MYEDYNIDQFMDAWFKKDYSELSEADFKIVRAEYEDTSGLYLTEDFENISFIHHLKCRLNYVKLFVKLQRDFVEEFDIPFVRDFETLKEKYGYVVNWNQDKDDFEKQLKKIELRERKYESTLLEKVKELSESRIKPKVEAEDNEDSLKKSRISFIRMLNSLEKMGYNLNNNKKSVESLSLMIKQQLEEVEQRNTVMSNG